MRINWIWIRFIFVYQKNVKLTLKTGFWVKNTFWSYVLVLWIHKGYFVVKKLLWNVRIEAFWYTKMYYSGNIKSIESIFLLENVLWVLKIRSIIWWGFLIHKQTVDKNNIGAPKMRNNYVAISKCPFYQYCNSSIVFLSIDLLFIYFFSWLIMIRREIQKRGNESIVKMFWILGAPILFLPL